MTLSQPEQWVGEVHGGVTGFVEAMRGRSERGFFRHTWSSDLRRDERWGLINAVFAARILHLCDAVEAEHRQHIGEFIMGFQRRDGGFCDPWLLRQTRRTRWRRGLRGGDLSEIRGTCLFTAETRSALTALRHLKTPVRRRYRRFEAMSPASVRRYVHGLDWRRPWAAGSHFSAMIVFLCYPHNDLSDDEKSRRIMLINAAFEALARYRRPGGCWLDPAAGEVGDGEKVNGCMKVLLAYEWAERPVDEPERIIDLCLSVLNADDACYNLDVVYALEACGRQTDHRRDEVASFLLARLGLLQRFWHAERGGFSFYEGQCATHYYGARYAQPADEPDMHGTWLYTYAVALIARLCGLSPAFTLPRI